MLLVYQRIVQASYVHWTIAIVIIISPNANRVSHLHPYSNNSFIGSFFFSFLFFLLSNFSPDTWHSGRCLSVVLNHRADGKLLGGGGVAQSRAHAEPQGSVTLRYVARAATPGSPIGSLNPQSPRRRCVVSPRLLTLLTYMDGGFFCFVSANLIKKKKGNRNKHISANVLDPHTHTHQPNDNHEHPNSTRRFNALSCKKNVRFNS